MCFLNQFLDAPTNSLVFLQYAPSVPEFVELTGDNSTGVLYNLINAPLNSDAWPRGKELMQGYEDKFGVASGAYGVGLYEMTNFYLEALQKVGDPKDHKAIGQAIGEIKRVTAAGNLSLIQPPTWHCKVTITFPCHFGKYRTVSAF
jgi:branched-chain amino acid transport system substrate-binding protein